MSVRDCRTRCPLGFALAAATAAWSLGGCTARPPSSTTATVAPQVELGRRIYAERCGPCHDAGREAAPVLSADLLAGYLTARPLFDYVRIAMPSDAPGSMSDASYWAALAYVLQTRGLLPPGVVLGDSTAVRVRLRP